ncbi:hypothetical protein [Myroides odoratus]|uniref:hypothetical protein n=1 Tax=Myroides odoratus TaxID=256 RepID=UPI00333EF64B
MKKLLILTIAITLFSCSKSPQDKALKLIDNDLKRTLNDYNSYEFVELSKLDSCFTVPFDNIQYADSIIKLEALKQLAKEAQDEYESYLGYSSNYFINKRLDALKKAQYFLNKAKTSAQFTDSFRDTFKPKFNGWQAEHRFRANNAQGNKVLGVYKLTFNIAIDSITGQEDLSK